MKSTVEDDKNIIKSIIQDLCQTETDIPKKHMDESFIFIRPSGNPLNLKTWDDMMNASDVIVKSNNLVSIERLQVVNNMAYVCYVSHGIFSYKGVENDDIAVLVSILEKKNGTWKVVYGQRSTGRKPSETLPQFN